MLRSCVVRFSSGAQLTSVVDAQQHFRLRLLAHGPLVATALRQEKQVEASCLADAQQRLRSRFLARWPPTSDVGHPHTAAQERLRSRFVARWPCATDTQKTIQAHELVGTSTPSAHVETPCFADAQQRLRSRFLARWPSTSDAGHAPRTEVHATAQSTVQQDDSFTAAQNRLRSRFVARWPSAVDSQKTGQARELVGACTPSADVENPCFADAQQRLRSRFLARWPAMDVPGYSPRVEVHAKALQNTAQQGDSFTAAQYRLRSRFVARWPSAIDTQKTTQAHDLAGTFTPSAGAESPCFADAQQRLRSRFFARWPSVANSVNASEQSYTLDDSNFKETQQRIRSRYRERWPSATDEVAPCAQSALKLDKASIRAFLTSESPVSKRKVRRASGALTSLGFGRGNPKANTKSEMF